MHVVHFSSDDATSEPYMSSEGANDAVMALSDLTALVSHTRQMVPRVGSEGVILAAAFTTGSVRYLSNGYAKPQTCSPTPGLIS